MNRLLPICLMIGVLAGCARSLEGTYKLEIAMPNLPAMPGAAPLQRQLNNVVEAQMQVFEFGPGRKVTIRSGFVGTEASYKISGSTLRINLPQNTFMELTIDGDSLVGPMGIRYRKQ